MMRLQGYSGLMESNCDVDTAIDAEKFIKAEHTI